MRELSDLRGLREGRLQGGMKNGIPGPRDKGPGIFFSNATAMGSYRTHAMNISRGIADDPFKSNSISGEVRKSN